MLSADSDCRCLSSRWEWTICFDAHICSFARPDMGLINNVGVYLERLGTRENIARAKASCPSRRCRRAARFVNNADDMADLVCELGRLDERGVETILFDGTGAVPESAGARAVWAKDISVDDEGRPRFVLCARGFDSCLGERAVPCELGLRGIHNVSNACGAAAIGLACGLSLESVAHALADAEPEAGRQEVKRASSGAVVFDDSYNASPQAWSRRFNACFL
ncbi:MAG: Mur ligase family protein [Slackia sp.]